MKNWEGNKAFRECFERICQECVEEAEAHIWSHFEEEKALLVTFFPVHKYTEKIAELFPEASFWEYDFCSKVCEGLGKKGFEVEIMHLKIKPYPYMLWIDLFPLAKQMYGERAIENVMNAR